MGRLLYTRIYTVYYANQNQHGTVYPNTRTFYIHRPKAGGLMGFSFLPPPPPPPKKKKVHYLQISNNMYNLHCCSYVAQYSEVICWPSGTPKHSRQASDRCSLTQWDHIRFQILINLSLMEFPSVINWTSLFPF